MRAVAALLLLASPAWAARERPLEPYERPAAPEFWFIPNPKSADYLDLFRKPELWSEGRGKIQAYGFYQWLLNGDCPNCGANLTAAGAIPLLGYWGLDIAMEVGAVKEHTCQGETAARYVLEQIAIVEGQGGKVTDLAMDWPAAGGEHVFDGRTCGYTLEQTAAETAKFIRAVRRARPGIRVGDIEGYPLFPIDRLIVWLSLLYNQEGVALDFFHADIHHTNTGLKDRAKFHGDMRRLKAVMDANAIPFGMILWGADDEDDCAYYNHVMSWAYEVREMFGGSPPQRLIVESWAPAGVPTNLPEAGRFTHTRVLNQVVELFEAPSRPARYAPIDCANAAAASGMPPLPLPSADRIASFGQAVSFLEGAP